MTTTPTPEGSTVPDSRTTPMFVSLPADGMTRAVVHVVNGRFEVSLERLDADDDCWYEYGVASMDAADHLIATIR